MGILFYHEVIISGYVSKYLVNKVDWCHTGCLHAQIGYVVLAKGEDMLRYRHPTIQQIVSRGIREILAESDSINIRADTIIEGNTAILNSVPGRKHSLGLTIQDIDRLAFFLNNAFPGLNFDRDEIRKARTIGGLVRAIKEQLSM